MTSLASTEDGPPVWLAIAAAVRPDHPPLRDAVRRALDNSAITWLDLADSDGALAIAVRQTDHSSLVHPFLGNLADQLAADPATPPMARVAIHVGDRDTATRLATSAELKAVMGAQPPAIAVGVVFTADFVALDGASPTGAEPIAIADGPEAWFRAFPAGSQPASRSPITAIAVTPDGWEVVTGHGNSEVHSRDTTTGESIRMVGSPRSGAVTALAVTPDGTRVVCAHADGTVRFLRRADYRDWVSANPKAAGRPRAAVVTPQGDRIAVGTNQGTIRVWDLDGNPIGRSFVAHSEGIRALAVTADGSEVLSAGGGGAIRRWRIADGAPAGEPFAGHTDAVNALAVTPDGTRLREFRRNGPRLGPPVGCDGPHDIDGSPGVLGRGQPGWATDHRGPVLRCRAALGPGHRSLGRRGSGCSPGPCGGGRGDTRRPDDPFRRRERRAEPLGRDHRRTGRGRVPVHAGTAGRGGQRSGE